MNKNIKPILKRRKPVPTKNYWFKTCQKQNVTPVPKVNLGQVFHKFIP